MKEPSLKSLSKKYPALLCELAHSYLDEGRQEKAMKTIERYLDKYPDETCGLLVKGLVEEYLGEDKESEVTYRHIIDLDSKCRRALVRLNSLERNSGSASDYWKKSLFIVDPLSPIAKNILNSRDWTAPDAPASVEAENEQPVPVQTPEEESASLDTVEIEEEKADSGPETDEESILTEQDEVDGLIQQSSKSFEEISEPAGEVGAPSTAVDAGKSSPEEEMKPDTHSEVVDEIDNGGLLDATDDRESDSGGQPDEGYRLPERLDRSDELRELAQVYQEIRNHGKNDEPNLKRRNEKEIQTGTLGELYAAQGQDKKAMKIFNLLPEKERGKYRVVIDKIKNR